VRRRAASARAGQPVARPARSRCTTIRPCSQDSPPGRIWPQVRRWAGDRARSERGRDRRRRGRHPVP
jgi:hypothetical protein